MKEQISLTLLLFSLLTGCGKSPEKTVFLSILARNKEAVLPRYLKCIENLDYDKGAITVYINTNNNRDQTEEILKNWSKKQKKNYRKILFEAHQIDDLGNTNPHEWTTKRFSTLAKIRNKSLELAAKHGADYYFIVDCDNFIASSTLKTLISKNKPIIAPMLRAIPEPEDSYSNFFGACTPSGYFQNHPSYWAIHSKAIFGTIEVPLVHCTYLVEGKYLKELSYEDESDDYEFVVFARNARKAKIKQYICNEEDFGVLLHFSNDLTLEEERNRVENILRLPPL